MPPACNTAFLPGQDLSIDHMKHLSVNSCLALLLASLFTHSFIYLFIQHIVSEHLLCSGIALGSSETIVSKVDLNSPPESQNLIQSNSLLDLMLGMLSVSKNFWFPTFSGPSWLPDVLLYTFLHSFSHSPGTVSNIKSFLSFHCENFPESLWSDDLVF